MYHKLAAVLEQVKTKALGQQIFCASVFLSTESAQSTKVVVVVPFLRSSANVYWRFFLVYRAHSRYPVVPREIDFFYVVPIYLFNSATFVVRPHNGRTGRGHWGCWLIRLVGMRDPS